ncbi:hypothetical protein AAFF_G00203850 [Aldrovandia affinis]|uniref:Uncharacterized protein n=1 Tax=Aldrovandia affinis TaxID=143900 RepID=A0AAD7SX50_9TELE|nr:hypothetical protein AAFF_G00203850 [Aldrovandia affinis]
MQTVGLFHTLEQCLNRMQTVGLFHTLEQCLNRIQTGEESNTRKEANSCSASGRKLRAHPGWPARERTTGQAMLRMERESPTVGDRTEPVHTSAVSHSRGGRPEGPGERLRPRSFVKKLNTGVGKEVQTPKF